MLTVKKLVQLLETIFAEDGSNTRKLQDAVYSTLMKYLREASSKLIDTCLLFIQSWKLEIFVNLIHPMVHICINFDLVTL